MPKKAAREEVNQGFDFEEVKAALPDGQFNEMEPTKVSKSTRAGTKFPVGRIGKFQKQGRYAERIGAGSPVYLAAVLEYLTCEIVEFASIKAK